MNIKLTLEQEKFIEVQVNSGKFATFEEVINREGLDGEMVIMDILNRFKTARK